ncbi:hypothetical protein GCK72_024785 [Caenorhabditis remanei]|uniref:Uncharacterized protein n=1 Tax=Caenorhabditis remanei TaxID=31234 RepID=A0A6A5G065_CAERE|nr:hypothetical protein GCK72_024785 [Caenorhabditis remanei]KAF1748318.1 hypothetical protein GCK72_024785 [Caenorhabditis remanei]
MEFLSVWEHARIYWTPAVFSAISLFVFACTATKKAPVDKRNLQHISGKCKERLFFGNLIVLIISLTYQIVLWKWKWHTEKSYLYFLIVNLIMTSVYSFFMSDNLVNVVSNYQYQHFIPIFAYLPTLYIFPYTAPGDSWLYNLHLNFIMAVTLVELHTILTDNLRLHVLPEIETEEEFEEFVEEDGIDFPDDSASETSEDDWEKFEDTGFQKQRIPCRQLS